MWNNWQFTLKLHEAFEYALQDQVTYKDPSMSEKDLINQLIAAIKEENTSRILKEKFLQELDINSVKLRECALRWTDMNDLKARARQVNCEVIENDCGVELDNCASYY